ncbi:MAG: hypothetical protein HOW73_31625 [Polyangiaceae bacterium]|nr:hypothetical protein [Polyangiaceae bacterium]
MSRARLLPIAIGLVAALASAAGCSDSKSSPTSPSSSASGSTADTSSKPIGPTPAEMRGSAPVRVAPRAPLERQPKIALYVNDPWAMVLGSEIPSTVVYADGSVVRAEPNPPRLVDGRLDGDVAGLAASLEASLMNEPAQASLTHATDQPTVSILLETPNGWILRSVYGLLPDGKASVTGKFAQGEPSERFVSALGSLRALQLKDPHVYTPAKVEVMLWGYEHSPETPAPWPATIPAPDKPVPPAQGVLRHFIDGKHLAELDNFRASLGQKQAVSLAGHKWSIDRRILVPDDQHLADVRTATWRAYAEATQKQQ